MKEQIKTEDSTFFAEVKKIINQNDHYKTKDPLFPKLPKVFKTNRNDNKYLEEINRGHSLSVLSGYNQRVANYFKCNSI